MKATDLRIGNLVNYNGKEISISPIGLNELFYIGDNFADSKIEKREYLPISLTEEWLYKFGFENNYESKFRKTYDLLIKERCWHFSYTKENENPLISSFFEVKGMRLDMPTYVHQLQNIFFAIENIELTIKL